MEEQPGPTVRFLLTIIRGLLLMTLIITLPLGYLISKIINYIGTDSVRVRGGELQIPVVTLVHPDTKRKVTLVGVMHVALPVFFREIQQILAEQKGSTVLYEGPKTGWSKQLEGLTHEEQSAVRWERLSTLKEACEARRMGMQFQKYGLRYEDHWIDSDLSPLEVIRLLMRNGRYPVNLDTTMPSGHNSRWLWNAGFMNMPLASYTLPLVILLTPDLQKTFHIALDIRNEVAIEKIFEHCRDNDVITIWGAEHIKAFGKALRKAGFKETGRTWHTAYRRQKFPFFETEMEE